MENFKIKFSPELFESMAESKRYDKKPQLDEDGFLFQLYEPKAEKSSEFYDSDLEKIIGNVKFNESLKNTDHMIKKLEHEEAYESDINGLWKWLDFMEMSWGNKEVPNPNEADLPLNFEFETNFITIKQ